jgi:multidrug resistance efflux pump
LRFSIALAAAALLILVFIPLWRDREGAYFAVEPMKESTLHAAVPGVVDAVMVREGQTVRAGQPLLKMSSGMASALRSDAEAAAGSARYQAFEAELEGKRHSTEWLSPSIPPRWLAAG